jgi:lysophospholipase L1-like esterase
MRTIMKTLHCKIEACSRLSRQAAAVSSLRLPRALLGRAGLAFLVAAASACGDDPAPPQQSVATEMPAPTPAAMPAAPANPATPAPASTPNAPPPANPPAANNEAPPAIVPLQPEPPPAQGGNNDTGGNNTGGNNTGGNNTGGSGGSAATPPPEMPPAQPPAFAPCPTDGTPCAIMPMGDSITFGIGAQTPTAGQGGYRVDLFRRALADNHEITFVGRVANGPTNVNGQPFPRNHEGYSGSTINDGGNQLANRIGPAFAAADPHIVLLMIGTNDVFGNQNNPPSDLGNLLDQITDAAPDALLVVAQIVPTQQAAANQRVQAYNATIPALVQERVAAGKHLALVDMFTPFVSSPGGANSLLSDILHPNDAGYVVMAQTWYAAIEPFLP